MYLQRLKELYAGWKTEDLKKAITVDKADYELEIINIIKEELQSRNVTIQDLEGFHKTYVHEEESLMSEGKLFCLRCHSLDIRTERPWWSYFLIGLFVIVLPKYRCNDCGYSFRKIKGKAKE